MIIKSAQTYPLLPLETWRRAFSINPLSFWGLRSATLEARSGSADSCRIVFPEYGWQSADQAGREDVRQAIIDAQTLLTNHLTYSPVPRYVEYTIQYPHFYAQPYIRAGQADTYGNYRSVNTFDGYIQALGTELITVIDNDVTITYSDEDNDGYDETATITVATTETDTSKIAVYYRDADIPYGDERSEQWRINPITVRIAAGTATITWKAWQSVNPVLYQALGTFEALDADDAATYVTAVQVCTRTTDPTGTTYATAQAAYVWEAQPACCQYIACCASCGATTNETDPAAVAYAAARGGIRNSRAGVVSVGEATYNVDTQLWTGRCLNSFCENPQRVIIRAYAGYPFTASGAIQNDMVNLLSYLTAAQLTRPVAACLGQSAGNRSLNYWQTDVANTQERSGNEVLNKAPDELLNNPLGTSRGHIFAWQYILNQRPVRAVNF